MSKSVSVLVVGVFYFSRDIHSGDEAEVLFRARANGKVVGAGYVRCEAFVVEGMTEGKALAWALDQAQPRVGETVMNSHLLM